LEEKKMVKTNPSGVLAAAAGAALVGVGLLVLMLVVVHALRGRPFLVQTAK
jgi:hypothetical protein